MSEEGNNVTATINDLREWLVAKAEGDADWREQKAVEHPDDVRNKHSATALRELASRLSEMPEDDEHLTKLWQRVRPLVREADRIELLTETEEEAFRQYGFNNRSMNVGINEARKFLDELCYTLTDRIVP